MFLPSKGKRRAEAIRTFGPKVQQQVDYYFSPDNLRTDTYLCDALARSHNRFPIDELIQFRLLAAQLSKIDNPPRATTLNDVVHTFPLENAVIVQGRYVAANHLSPTAAAAALPRSSSLSRPPHGSHHPPPAPTTHAASHAASHASARGTLHRAASHPAASLPPHLSSPLSSAPSRASSSRAPGHRASSTSTSTSTTYAGAAAAAPAAAAATHARTHPHSSSLSRPRSSPLTPPHSSPASPLPAPGARASAAATGDMQSVQRDIIDVAYYHASDPLGITLPVLTALLRAEHFDVTEEEVLVVLEESQLFIIIDDTVHVDTLARPPPKRHSAAAAAATAAEVDHAASRHLASSHSAHTTARFPALDRWLSRHPAPPYATQGFSLVTYNLLAPFLATRDKFPYCDRQVLSWATRFNTIQHAIAAAPPDILCLQELQYSAVPKEHHAAQVVSFLRKQGYEGELTALDHPSRPTLGVGVYVQRSVFTVLERKVIVFADYFRDHCKNPATKAFFCSHHRAIALRLQHRPSGHVVVVVALHLVCAVDEPVKMSVQLVALSRALRKFVGADPLIIAGDFNTTPQGGAYELMTRGHIHHAADQARPSPAAERDGVHLPLDLVLPHTFTSAYQAVLGSEPAASTHVGGEENFHDCLDYVFFSGRSLQARAVLEVPGEREGRSGFPDEENPSDHVPLGVQFVLG